MYRRLTIEALILFLLIPLLFYFRVLPKNPIPFLVATAIGAFLLLRRDPGFSQEFFNFAGLRENLGPVLLRTVGGCLVVGLCVWYFAPDLLFALPKTNPAVWAAIMILYPLISVYPQELIYRAFFFHRYGPLLGSPQAAIWASAAAFSFVHIIFGNWISVFLTALGGVLFSYTYRKSQSLLLTSIEHALYGNFMFTIGLGQFFYHGFRH